MTPPPAVPMPPAEDHVCSAKGCRASAVHAVVWRNPKLHVEGRRKVWLACDEHQQALADFVGLRGFLIEVIPVGALTDADG
ncbi:hypothetical protein [Intrasporangium sp.]|uniref:hypothetical protein n=1 Tax=Intrasporangium sp. TaxID=1925024 RepID=UPI00293A3BCE|nr:hypothetical protein [Intrasporangium sp.]MDV3220084.1 hypothetical protein [Intrasporangium sp.]